MHEILWRLLHYTPLPPYRPRPELSVQPRVIERLVLASVANSQKRLWHIHDLSLREGTAIPATHLVAPLFILTKHSLGG